MKQLLVILCWLNGCHLLCQAALGTNPYLVANYSVIGDKILNQRNLPVVFKNLKGPVKSIIQDCYDKDGNYVGFKSDRDASSKYVFNEERQILQRWYYSDRDEHVIKEIYYDFKEQRPQYQMKFYAPGLLDYSITYLYNNRGICLGTKTTQGMNLTKNTYQIFREGDTTFMDTGAELRTYLGSRLISEFHYENQSLESFAYFGNGAVHEWSMKENGFLKEVMEFDLTGRLIERQFFSQGKDPLVIESHLVIYHYNDKGLLETEDHRLSMDKDSNYKVSYSYDATQLLVAKRLTSGDKEKSLIYSYNEHGDCLTDDSDYKSNTEVSLVYTDYDDHGNWLTKKVTGKNGIRKYTRRIEYFEDQ